jgi:broad specificity phosphatase PhoE
MSGWRDRSWLRRKLHGETWPRFSAEVPPELAEAIDAAQRKSLGVNQSAATRANVVRAGLRLYLNTVDPEPEPPTYDVDGEVVEIVDLPMLEGRV